MRLMLRVCGGAKWGKGNMMNDFIKQAIEFFEKNRSDEDLVDVIKKVLETDINLDFLLELKTRELELLTACIRDRIGQVTN
jgi:hypothetical protein